MSRTKIPWCHETLNPITGCTRVSEGCLHCYAHTWAKRFRGGYFGIQRHPERIKEFGAKRLAGKRVFVGSMTDLGHPNIPAEWLREVVHLMMVRSDVTWIVLTKRAKRFAAIWREYRLCHYPWIWPGCSAENQERFNERWPDILATRARTKIVSVEPMLGPVDVIPNGADDDPAWAICGPETGSGARPCDPAWIKALSDQCGRWEIPFFDKRTSFIRRELPTSGRGEA